MADTAVHRVFAIAELTRLVLNNVESGKDLFNAKKTCRTFNDHVNTMLQELTAGSDTAQRLTSGEATINPFLDFCYTKLPCDGDNERYFVFKFTAKFFATFKNNADLSSQLPFTLFATEPPRSELRLFVYHITKPLLQNEDDISYFIEHYVQPMMRAGVSLFSVSKELSDMAADPSYKDSRVLENKTGVTVGDIVKRLGTWTNAANKLVMVIPDTGSDACDEAMSVLDAAIKKLKSPTPKPGISGA